MPVKLPGYVFDPETNRYYKEVRRSEESSSNHKVMQRITLSSAKKKRKTRRTEGAQGPPRGSHPSPSPSAPTDRRMYPDHGNFSTLERLLFHRECGNPEVSRSWSRLCYESTRGVFMQELRNVPNLWFGEASRGPVGSQNGRASAAAVRGPALSTNQRTQVHFNAFLGASGGYLWSRAATNKVVSDDALVCTCFVPERAAVHRGPNMSPYFRAGPIDPATVHVRATHTMYPTKSPAIHVGSLPLSSTHRAHVFGFLGSGLEPGKVVVHKPTHQQDLLPKTLCLADSSLHCGYRGASTLVHKSGGTIWTAKCLDRGPLLSLGERESARVLQVSAERMACLSVVKYTSDVLAQACVPQRSLVIHGLRNGHLHLCDWRAASKDRTLAKCKAGRSITEIVAVPGDPNQFAILGYMQLPRLWDVRMQRHLVKYASSHLALLDQQLGIPAEVLDTLKVAGTSSLRVSSDAKIVGCVKRLKSVTDATSALDLIQLWSLKTGKPIGVSTDNGYRGRTCKDFIFLEDAVASRLNLPTNSMALIEQSTAREASVREVRETIKVISLY